MVCGACVDNASGTRTRASATAAAEHPQLGQNLALSGSFRSHSELCIKGHPYEQGRVKGKVQHDRGNLKRAGLLKYASCFCTRSHDNNP